MADHVDVARPALVEMPLWAIWRVASCLADSSHHVADWLDAYDRADSANRRLIAFAAVLTGLALALAVFVVALLLT